MEVLQGTKRLTAQLYALADADFLPALAEGVEKEILPEMQRLTPVDTGNLRDSEHVEISDDKVILVAGGGDNNVEYATYVEMGTSRMAAQPYMRPAIDAKRDAAMIATAEGVSKTMAKTVKETK